jgi:hypothetical protein
MTAAKSAAANATTSVVLLKTGLEYQPDIGFRVQGSAGEREQETGDKGQDAECGMELKSKMNDE